MRPAWQGVVNVWQGVVIGLLLATAAGTGYVAGKCSFEHSATDMQLIVARFGKNVVGGYNTCMHTNAFGDLSKVDARLSRDEACGVLVINAVLSTH